MGRLLYFLHASQLIGILVVGAMVVSLLSGCRIAEIEHERATNEPGPITTAPEFLASTAMQTPPSPTPKPTKPIHLTIHAYDSDTLTPEQLLEFNDFVVIGTVVEELPAFWSTPDRKRPDNIHDFPQSGTIVTPYVIQLEVPENLKSLTGPVIPLVNVHDSSIQPIAKQVVVVTHGGRAGEDIVTNTGSDGAPLQMGERVLLAIADFPLISEAPHQLVPTTQGDGWWMHVKYTLMPEGDAVNYTGTQPSIDLVKAILKATAGDPTTAPAR